ncbi:hypothetical protein CMEL01_04159 [Colletotrichum melonis]|uniref:Uncharacterized protein n=1 Tax=Colletotrichum melonis TaxID=1209925 RepID=A0AAI9UG60_9PEZI|nr:hypothetical protein CMEL01_04159 [Colletotrichum melonis]
MPPFWLGSSWWVRRALGFQWILPTPPSSHPQFTTQMVLRGLDSSPTPLLEPPTLRCTREPNSDLAIRIVTSPSLTCLNPTAQYLDLHHSAASLQIIRHASDAGMALSPSRALGSQRRRRR